MTAVSQSYPNYLGGLNEQPDELKKPGQLVEALNVIPDPVIGLTRRPGFQLAGRIPGIQPEGTWFEMEFSNQVNEDYIYFGCVNPDGTINIINQDGEPQLVKYTGRSVVPHQKYEYNSNVLTITDDNNETDTIPLEDDSPLGYFRNSPKDPLKYCVSKNHIIFTNPTQVPSLADKKVPSEREARTYYSFVTVNVFDPENYNYVFKLFFEDGSSGNDPIVTYTTIKDVELESVEDVLGDYDRDLTLPLQTESPFIYELQGPGVVEAAVVEVNYVGQVVQLKSSDGDGFRNEARYTWSTRLITPGKGYSKGQVFEITQPGLNGLPDLELKFKVQEITKVTATENKDIRPTTELSNLDVQTLLSELANGFRDGLREIDSGAKVIVVGNGIYLEADQPFSVSTAEIAVADVMNSQKINNDIVPIVRVNTVAELPVECYKGFIVEVLNSFDDKDNYYLEYKAESQDSDLTVVKADGYWEEIAKPYEMYNPENTTLPHMITVARESDQTKFAFIVSPIEYKKRTAGTAEDNPSMFEDFTPISAINYYKNRLFFFTRIGTIISSRAGEIDNLFLNTAVNVSAIDPIDIIANSNERVPIHSSAVVNNGLVLFGSSEQYSLTTSNDLLTSETVSVTKVSNYTCDPVSNPIYLGTNLGFVSNGLTRFYEMTNVYDRGPVDINERSQQIQTQFGRGFNMPVSSREQSQVIVYRKYDNETFTNLNRSMYLYRFRQESSQESSQTSWVRWQIDRPVAYVSMPNDKMFVILDNGNLYKMESTTISNTNNPSLLGGVPQFTDGWSDDGPGSTFTSRIVFPTIYPRTGESQDITSNTTIHRVKLSTSLIGTYNLEIKRDGYDTYDILVEQTPADDGSWGADIPTFRGEHIETVPIYTRNQNLNLTMSTNYDAPLTLRSMTWEGDWNPPYYKRV